MKTTIRLFSFFCFFLIIPCEISAQNPVDYQIYKIIFPNESTIVLEHRESAEITLEKGSAVVTTHIYNEKLFLNEKEQAYTNEYIYSSFSNKVKNVKAFYLEPDGSKYKKHSIKSIATSDYLDDNIFYSDTRRKEVVFPHISEGGRTTLNYDLVTDDPHFSQSCFFSSYLPTAHSEFSITFPEGVSVKYFIFNDDSNKIKFTETKIKGKTIWKWVLDNSEALKFESDAPGIRYYAPHIVAFVEKYKSGNEIKTVYTSLDDLYHWYYSFVKDLNQEPDPGIKHTVDSLVSRSSDTLDRIRQIYYWVQDHISYVAIEDSMAGLIPSHATEVYNKRYGDCKGMSCLLHEMYKTAGIPAYLTWIGTRDLPYDYSKVYLPVVDNHMIVTVIFHGQHYIIDGTSNYTKFGSPSAFIQGKEALIGLSENKYEVYRVPEMPKETNVFNDSSFVIYKDNKLIGTGIYTTSGYYKSYLAGSLEGLSGKKLEDRVSDFVQKGNNKFKLDAYSLFCLQNKDSNAIVRFKFTIPDYTNYISDRLYINLNLDKIYKNNQKDIKKKKYDATFKYKALYRLYTEFTIPDGYKTENIPANSEYINEQFGFKITYTVKGKQIIFYEELYNNILTLKKSDFPEWNKMIEKLNSAYSQAITLVKVKP